MNGVVDYSLLLGTDNEVVLTSDRLSIDDVSGKVGRGCAVVITRLDQRDETPAIHSESYLIDNGLGAWTASSLCRHQVPHHSLGTVVAVYLGERTVYLELGLAITLDRSHVLATDL